MKYSYYNLNHYQQNILIFRADFRYEACLARVKFEDMLSCKDPVKAHSLLLKAEQDLFQNKCYQPRKCEYCILR